MDDPIIYADGDKSWWLNGKLHREDGPAIIDANGNNYWSLNDTYYEFDDWLKLTPISDEDKFMMKLTYG